MNVTEINVQSGKVTARAWTPEERARKEAGALVSQAETAGLHAKRARRARLEQLLDLIDDDPTILDRLKAK